MKIDPEEILELHTSFWGHLMVTAKRKCASEYTAALIHVLPMIFSDT